MEAKIQINYNEVDRSARRYIEYLGSKSTTPDYERMMLQVEDSEWLGEVHDEMISGLTHVLETWLVRAEDTSTGKSVTLYIPDNARSTGADNVQRKSFAFCVSYLESRWLQICGHEMAGVRATEADIHLKSIRTAMTHRRPPIRRTYPNPITITGRVEGMDAEVSVIVSSEQDEINEIGGLE